MFSKKQNINFNIDLEKIEKLLNSFQEVSNSIDLEKAKSEIDFMINRIKGNKYDTNNF